MNNIVFAVVTLFLYKETCAIIRITNDAVNPLEVPGGQLIEKIFLPKYVKGNFTELAHGCGNVADRHMVVTKDGYILEFFRLRGKKNCYGKTRSPPVVLMHGWVDSADSWLLAGCDVGLGYGLANACYDVWCASYRGDFYGRSHTTLDPNKDAEFWNFAFEEIGEIDVPTVINYITKYTGSRDVFYVGVSQGTTDFFVMASSMPEYNDKIRLGIMLAPIAWLDHVSVKIFRLLGDNYPLIHKALNASGIHELFGRKQPAHRLVEVLCGVVPEACSLPIAYLGGDRPGTISSRTLEFVAGHLFSGTSAKNLIQYGQILRDRRFARYDYGRSENLQLYGTHPPPEYDLTKVRAPLVLMAGPSDRLSVIADVDRIYSKLPNVLEYYIIPDPGFGHFNFAWGKTLPKYVTPKILEYFNAYSDEANYPHH